MESIETIIERCMGQQPDKVLGGHYGYYLHNDVTALVTEITRLRLALKREDGPLMSSLHFNAGKDS